MEEDKEAVLRRLEEAVEAQPDDDSLRFNLAVFLWENCDNDDGESARKTKEKAAEHFVASAKFNPQNGAAFRYLGHHYSQVFHDSQRAMRCYQRAVSLNPDDSHSGEALCDLLDVAGKETLEIAVCREASEKSPRASWAFRRLGYLLVHQKKWSEAVQSLQHAIRGYPTCADLWEALGLAYQRLGRFTAALKSYGRSIELESAKVFSLVESGNVFLMLGSFKKGVEQFRQALDLSPKCVSAFYGLACGLLGMAKECICLGALQWSATLLEEASKVANASTLLAGNLSCIWKLHGDIQLTYAKCYPWMEESQGSDYNAEAFSASILSWKNTCYLAAISARRSYQRSLLLAPWQANMYTDIAITSDLIYTLNKSSGSDLNVRQPSEKMAMGALLLERANHEFWVALGCLSDYNALKQHALIRALQLDVSLAVAWAYLGKLFRKEGEKLLARQAFDSARSVDPSLALPWAGMSADFQSSDPAPDEAFESCLRAAQTFPLAEFQIGLAKLALVSGHLYSSQVFGAIRQAVQHAPQYPECHNLNGLVCEAHADYQSAAACFRLARCALTKFSDIVPKSHSKDISINLARSLCRAGNAADALQECENLKKEGLLGVDGLQIYALSLWQLGKNDLVLSAARNLAATVSTMDHMSAAAAAAVCLICRLLFRISGMDSAINSILKMPKGLFQSSKISFIVSSIHALDRSNRLESVVSSSRKSLRSQEEICGMHFLIAIGKLIKHGSEYCLQFQNGIAHLRKALHMYPNSVSLRSLLGYLLLSNEGWYDSHVATRCCSAKVSCYQKEEGLKSAYEILGAGAVACYAISTINPKFSFPTCTYQCLNGQGAIQQLQKCLRQEPWNQTARYLLILNLLQKAREEKFPRNLCNMLERLILVALSQEAYSKSDMSHQYKKFQLLLSAAEICLQGGNQIGCIDHANNASLIVLPDGYLFFSHLLLCRAYASSGDIMNLEKEYMRCLGLKTDCHIGWICLKFIASRFRIQNDSDILQSNLKKCLLENSGKMWMAVYNLVLGLVSVWNMDFLSAEQFLLQACSLASAESCLQLCHGVISMELSRQLSDPHYISLAIRSLNKAQAASPIPLPIVSILLAQAEGSLGSREKWEHNLRLEWFTWPPEMRPAELLFQMHFLAIQSKSDISSVEFCQSPQRWVLRAIHTNPSCMRYWKVAQKILE